MSFNINLIAFFALIIASLSCKKEEASLYWGEVSTLKNGAPWSGKIKAASSNFAESKVEIIIKTFDEQNIPVETLGFYKVPARTGKYKLSRTINQPPDDSLIGALYANGFDDAVYDFFEIAQGDSTSYVEITHYNEKTAEITGTFNLILWRQKDMPGSWNAPDSIIFSNGVFHTRIND